jgi:hypothetical protein
MTRVRSPGGWNDGSVVPGDEFEALDEGQHKAIKWGAGDVYEITGTPLAITGTGLQVAGDGLRVDTSLYVTNGGALTLEDASGLSIRGASTVVVQNTVSTRYIDSTTVAFEDTSALQIKETASIALTNSASLTLANTASLSLSGTAAVTLNTGTTLTSNVGSTVNLKGTVKLFGATEVQFDAARTYTATIKGVLGYNPTEWTANGGGYFDQTNPPNSMGTPTSIKFIMDVPAGATITGIDVRIDPASSHGSLPDAKPSVHLAETNPASGTSTTITSITDGSGDVTAYQAARDFSETGLSYTTTVGRLVIVAVFGEGGANEIAGLKAYPPRVTYTMAKMSTP